MGCAGCHEKGGCDARKATQREILDGEIARLYPDRTWGHLDDAAGFGAGPSRREAQRLARAISQALEAPVFFRGGDEDDLCHFVYVLCVGRPPALVDVRDGLAHADATSAEDRYLRVCLSSVARLGAVQEVVMTLEDDEGVSSVREAPRAGVFDPTLLKRMQKLVALLEASDIRHIDFGLLDQPLDGGRSGDYETRFGVAPRLANFLFYAAPPTTASLSFVGTSPSSQSASAR